MPEALYENYFGERVLSCVRLPGSGSNRVYYLITGETRQVIAVCVENLKEGDVFVKLADLFKSEGINVPEIYYHCADGRWTLQEYLGDKDLLSYLLRNEGQTLCEQTMCMLARMQTIDEEKWEELVGFQPLGERLVKWDLNYFKYEYLKPSGIDFDEEALENDFDRLCATILAIPDDEWGFMMRDCQSRNVMIKDGEPYFIDFQGGRRGPALYDAISFTWQAKANLSYAERDRLTGVWAKEFAKIRGVPEERLLKSKPVLTLFRLLQVLGAYGFRGIVERKAHFLESIKPALGNLKEILGREYLRSYPELERICRMLTEDRRFKTVSFDGLTVKVSSFSYKKGYPDDFSGNGGGFMFDCRWMHNPGRYEEYKHLTGLDLPVINFLEARGEVQQFVEDAFEMCRKAIHVYVRRGFSSLQIGFGCTGGRHRSVYCAENIAKKIAESFPEVRVILNHREQSIEKEIKL